MPVKKGDEQPTSYTGTGVTHFMKTLLGPVKLKAALC